MKAKIEDSIVPNKALFSLHKEAYHRRVKEFDVECELCKVWNEVVDIKSWEEMMEIAQSDTKVV